MNRLREFIGSSSGLAPIRLGLSVLAGLAVLIEINKAEADPVCLTPTCLIGINKAEANRLCPTPTPTCIPCPNTWIQCFDCSANSEHPICARADTDPVEPEAKYLYCIYALDADCSFYIKRVHLALYNVLGHRVRQLWHGPLGAGSHRFVWDGRDRAGARPWRPECISIRSRWTDRWKRKKTTKLP